MNERIFTARRALVLALAVVAAAAGSARAGETTRLYVTADASQLLVLGDPMTKLAVANPGIVDLHVVSPTQVLINGKASGVTSLTVFYAKRAEAFEVVVNPGPAILPRAPLAASEPHTVIVHRAGRMDNHLFVRDHDKSWLELKHDAAAGSRPQSPVPLPNK